MGLVPSFKIFLSATLLLMMGVCCHPCSLPVPVTRLSTSSWVQLGISYDVFVRTTQPVHAEVVSQVLEQVWETDVYKAAYSGWYCVGCEEYKDELELGPGDSGSLESRGLCRDRSWTGGSARRRSAAHRSSAPACCAADGRGGSPARRASRDTATSPPPRPSLHDAPDAVPASGGGQLLLCTVALPAAA